MLRIPALERDRGAQVLQRPGELHARQPVHPRARRPRCAELLRRRRLQLRRHRVGRRRGSGTRRVDRRTARPTTDLTAVDIRRFARVQRQQPLAARPGRRGARPALRDPLAQPRDARRPGRSGAPRSTTCSSEANASFGSKMGWERAELLRPAGSAPAIEYSWAKPNWLPWVAAEHANTRTQSPSSTRRRSRSTSSSAPTPRRALQWLCTADVAVPPGRDRLHRAAQRPRHLRVGRDRHPDRRDRVPRRQQRRDDRAGPGPHPAATCPPGCAATVVDVTSATPSWA